MMYDMDSLPGLIELGHLNEKGVCEIEFDVTDWLALYPLGVLNITYIRPGESTVYPVDITGVSIAAPTSGNLALALADEVYTLTWTVSDAVTAIAGSGSVVVELAEGTGVVKRSSKVQTYTADGHAAAGDPPEPLQSWVDQYKAVDVVVNEVPTGETDGSVSKDSTGLHFVLDIAKGNGIASIVRTAGTGAPGTVDTYTITFDDGTTTTYDLAHGVQGATGASITEAEFDGADIVFTKDDETEVTIVGGKTALIPEVDVLNEVIVKGISHVTKHYSTKNVGPTGTDGEEATILDISVPCRIEFLTSASVKNTCVLNVYIKDSAGANQDELQIDYPWLTSGQKAVSVVNLATHAGNETHLFKVQLNTADKYVLYLLSALECPDGVKISVSDTANDGNATVDAQVAYYAVEVV